MKSNKNLLDVKIVKTRLQSEIGKNERFEILLNHIVKFLKQRR